MKCGALKKSAYILLAFMLLVNMSGCGVWSRRSRSITYNLRNKPDSIDPAVAASNWGGDVILASFEGLMKLDRNSRAIPGIASSYTKDSDIKYTFHLRNAKWSDGRPVYAEDFEYAWKRALSPETGGEYAYMLYYLKNGEAYNKGSAPSADVGVRATDHNTLEVTLESPTPYFLDMLSYPSYMPVRKDIIYAYEGGWTADPSSYVGNGPFRLVSISPDGSLEFVRNKKYYDVSKVRIDKLKFTVIEDAQTYFTAWEDGDVDVIDSPPTAAVSGSSISVNPYLGVYFYSLNTSVKPLNDRRVRRALSYAIDRTSVTADGNGVEVIPATGFVPYGMPDVEISSNFRSAGGEYLKPEAQTDSATKLLSDAGYPGGAGFPRLTLTYNEGGFHEMISKAVKRMWKENLGIDVTLEQKSWGGLQKSIAAGSFEIIRCGWIADYPDPLSFMELFISRGANNASGYANAAYDELVASAKYESDPQKRSGMLHRAEKILMDDMPIIPIYFYGDDMMIKPSVKGIVRSPLGYTYFDRAYVR